MTREKALSSIREAAKIVFWLLVFFCWTYAVWMVAWWHEFVFLGTVIVVPWCFYRLVLAGLLSKE